MSTTDHPLSHANTPSTAAMRTLVGVDAAGLYRPALNLLGRLRFAGNETTLIHVDPPVGAQFTPAPLVYEYETAEEIATTLRNAGTKLLEVAEDEARAAGMGEQTGRVYAVGSLSSRLLEEAEARRADLIAIGSELRGPLRSIFLGSVGRALAIGAPCPFLVARGEVKEKGSVRAVFATDHSEYADRCFARLLDMTPQGLKRVTIVTATESIIDPTLSFEVSYDVRTPYSITEAEDAMKRRGAAMVDRLQARGIEADYRLVEGLPEEALRSTMNATGSDLLILGARGHGLVERLLIGSLALHMVVAEPFSVLVLRIPENA